MGFCTANSIDLINMTSSGDECVRSQREGGEKMRCACRRGTGGETGPFQGRRLTAQLSQAWGAKR